MSIKRLLFVCLGLLLLAASVQAGQITFTFDFTRLRLGSLSLDRGSAGILIESVYAGKGTATVISDSGLLPDLQAGQIFDTYCVDLLHNIYSYESPQVGLGSMQNWNQPNPGPSGTDPGSYPWATDPHAGSAAAYLYNNYRNDGLVDANKADREAGLQLAIWEVLYEGDTLPSGMPSYNIADGKISFTGFSSQVTVYANTYLNGLSANWNNTVNANALWLQTSNNDEGLNTHTQDFIATNTVPEPAAIVLVGTGVALLAGIQFRKKRAKQVHSRDRV
jgi:hypothetical protein